MLLTDLGADVIKVEPPAGDMTRFVGPFTAQDTLRAYGGYFASVNRGKRSIVLDLKQTTDCDVALQLATTVDVVVENSRAGVIECLGIGYETLAAANAKLVSRRSGTLNAVGLLAAVIHARSTGQGQFVDVAMYDAVLGLCEGAEYSYSYTGQPTE